MTEAEWLACDDPDALLDHLTNTPVSPRKKRLLACGCCRLIWDLLDESSRQAVIVSERFADGLADAAELERAARTAQAAWEERGQRLQGWMTDNSLWQPPRTPEGERLNTEYQQVGPIGNRSDRPLFQTPDPSLQDGRSERDD